MAISKVISLSSDGDYKVLNPNTDVIASKGIRLKQMPEEQINQPAHGLSVGNIVRYDSTLNKFVLSQANNSSNAEVYGIVSEVIDSDNFLVGSTKGGKLSCMSGLTPGAIYFLSVDTPGGYTDIVPNQNGQVSKAVFQAISTTDIIFHNYIGVEIEISTDVLPAISSGDANKIIKVKDDESGYELTSQIDLNPDSLIIHSVAGESISVGDVIGISYGSSDGKVYKCIANTSNKYQFIGIAISTGTLDDNIQICTYGFLNNAAFNFASADYGKHIFVDTTTSTITTNPDISTAGTVLMPIGIILNNTEIFIKPGYPSITQ